MNNMRSMINNGIYAILIDKNTNKIIAGFGLFDLCDSVCVENESFDDRNMKYIRQIYNRLYETFLMIKALINVFVMI